MVGDIDRIIALIRETGGVADITPDADFYEAGFSSLNALNLLLELETAFGLSIPDDKFIQSRSPRGIEAMIACLRQEQAA